MEGKMEIVEKTQNERSSLQTPEEENKPGGGVINIFSQITVKKDILHIHLMKLPAFGGCK